MGNRSYSPFVILSASEESSSIEKFDLLSEELPDAEDSSLALRMTSNEKGDCIAIAFLVYKVLIPDSRLS
jgi:hypothetical protein